MALTSIESRPSPGIEAVPDAPGSAHAATERVLRIVVLVWSAAWIVLMASEGADTSLAPALTWAMLAGLAVGWVVVVLARLPVGPAYVAALAGTALVQALLTPPLGLWSESGLLLTWTNLAAISCGFVVAGARGRIAVAAIAAGQLLILITRAWADGTLPLAWPGVVAAAAYALADGMAAHVAASAVRGQARETDAAAERLAVERARRAVREARVREAERISRVLHDTVLNTLGALRRGIDPAETDALRARCAHDLDELRHLRDTRFETTGDTGVGAEALVHALTARASVLSLELDVRSRITATTTLPTPVADAVAGACAEALVNVAKHSGTRAAELSLTWDGAVLEVGVHDEGCGWSGELLPEHGVSRSILGRAIAAGLDPLVATAPDRGTTVSLTWQAPVAPEEPADDAGAGVDPAAAHVLATVAVRAGSWLAGLLVFLSLVFWPSTGSAGTLVALAIVGLVLALTWRIGVRRGRVPIPAAYAVLLVVATFLVTALPARDATTCTALGEGWWGLDGAVVVLFSLVLLTRGWWWTAAGAVAMVLGALSLYGRPAPIPDDCLGVPAATAVFELSIVVAIVLFREALTRQWARASDVRSRAEALRIATEVREATGRARDARVDAVLAATVPLLDTLASGLAGPDDDGVRRQCATAESALRSLLTLGPAYDALRDVLGEAVLAAYAQGSAIEVMPAFGDVSLPDDPDALDPDPSSTLLPATDAPPAVEPLRALLGEVVTMLPAQGTATAALIRGPEGSSLTLVSDTTLAPLPVAIGRDLAAAGLLLDQAQVGTQSLVEVRWP